MEALCAVLGPLHLLEIGCGDGRYFDLYDESFGGLASYTGIDPRPRDSWRSDRPRRSFRQSTAEDISPETLKDTNLIVSQSAIEHIPDDRSEEHTSELQSLMRHSYAVFC